MGFDPIEPPMLTADLPGLGGRIKVEADDFEVEEIPAYEPAGEGEHLYLWIEKRSLGAEYFLRQIAKRLNLPTSEVGSAGLKDRHAVTRQWVSVPQSAEAQLPQLDGDGIRLLQTTRHTNKLKPGHLRGNRFRILIRDINAAQELQLTVILEKILQWGLPNYYGPQRFGHDGENAKTGFALLRDEPLPIGRDGRSMNVRNSFIRKLVLSSAQSYLFNATIGKRLLDGLLRTVLPGDAMMKWPFGGMFTAQDLAAEQTRFDRREIIPGGPMFGKKMFPTHATALEHEMEVLREYQLGRENFQNFGKLLSGTRRFSFIYIDDLTYQWEPDGLRLQFSLPSGCYATVLLREIMKSTLADEEVLDD